MNRSPLRAFLIIPFVLGCFALSPTAWALDPAPDGGYPNGNTAEGEDALFSLTIDATSNTAVGFHALFGDTSGSVNTAIGSAALANNTTGEYNTATGAGALELNSTGDFNVATGVDALHSNTTGNFNTAHGESALFSLAALTPRLAMGHSRIMLPAFPIRPWARRRSSVSQLATPTRRLVFLRFPTTSLAAATSQ